MSSLARQLGGKFLVLDGPDGSGKSTQLAMLRDRLLDAGGRVECVYDPGATPVGEKIRGILLDRSSSEIAPMCETLLFMASRAQLVAERIRPTLAEGGTVLCDRFISATVAYQGALGVPRQTVLELGRAAVGDVWPDLTIVLDVGVEVGMGRVGLPRGRRRRADESAGRTLPLFGDRLEVRESDYHKSVRRLFLELAKPGAYPRPVAKVDGRGGAREVHERILAELRRHFGGDEAEAG